MRAACRLDAWFKKCALLYGGVSEFGTDLANHEKQASESPKVLKALSP